MKKLLSVIIATGVLYSLTASAGSSSISKVLGLGDGAKKNGVAVVDMREIIKQAPQIEALKKQMGIQFDDKRKKLEKQRADVKKAEERFDREKHVMEVNKKKTMKTALDKQKKDLHDAEVAFQHDFFGARNKGLTEIFKSVTAIVEELAKKHHLKLVLDHGAVVYADKDINITEQVVKRLKKSTNKTKS